MNLANNGHNPAEAKFGDPYDTRAKSSLAGLRVDNSFNLMEILENVVVLGSLDPVKADMELHCHAPATPEGYPCGTHLCDTEPHDSLATLVRVAVAHFEEAHARE
jgi:hypothetical protein